MSVRTSILDFPRPLSCAPSETLDGRAQIITQEREAELRILSQEEASAVRAMRNAGFAVHIVKRGSDVAVYGRRGPGAA